MKVAYSQEPCCDQLLYTNKNRAAVDVTAASLRNLHHKFVRDDIFYNYMW